MSDATYILGTDEYVIWKIECKTRGFTYVPSEWTAKAAMVELGTAFVDEPESFVVAALTATDGTNYGKARLVDLAGTVAIGQYRIITRLTKTADGSETPLLKASGIVTVKAA
jgi:hypothetical protein